MYDLKIQYFIDYWRDLTHPNNSIEKELIHSIIYNPRELFKEFIEEINRNNLSNKDNKKIFIDKVNEFSKLNLNSLKFIKPTLKLIQQQFSKKDDYSYLLHLLKMAVLKLSNFTIGKNTVKELAEILTDDSKINTEKIKHLTNFIIFELIHKKYSNKKISNIIDYIFSDYQFINNILHTNFPHNIECENYNIESIEFKNYQKQIKDYIDNVTIQDRLLAINNYFMKKSEKLRFVFQIKGLKGNNVNFQIGNVQIYNPKTTKLFNDSSESFNEFFGKINNNIYYCNAAVTLEIIDMEYAKKEAIQILEKTLDIISSQYINYKVPLRINPSQYYVIDNNGRERGRGSTNTWEYIDYQDSLKLDNNINDSFNIILNESESLLEIDKRILESMHWKRKAIESNEYNEKILWHWVAIENLFSKKNQSTPETIFELVPKLLSKRYIFDLAWKYYHKLYETTVSEMSLYHHYRVKIDLSSNLKNKIGLNAEPGERVYLKNLIENIDEIKKTMNKESLFYEQLEFLQEIFQNNKKCLNLIEKFEKIFFEKLIYLYRIRNKIVHNAYNDVNPMIPYYVKFIMLISSISINVFINKKVSLDLKTSEEIINNINYDYDNFKLELQDKGTSVLLDT
jgi:hypothetical protein